MKKFQTLLIAVLVLCTMLFTSAAAIAVQDNENFFKNGSFEDENNIEMIVPEGFSATVSRDLEASAGVYSLKLSTNNDYTHIGYSLSLEEGRTYEYSFDVKLVSDKNGGEVTATTAV